MLLPFILSTYRYEAKIDGARIFNFTLEKISHSIEEVLRYADVSKEKVDIYILHQANKFIMRSIASQLRMPEGLFPMSTLTKYGNLAEPLSLVQYAMS